MDELNDELAAILAEREREQGIARVKALAGPETHPDFDGKTCVECGEDIPPVRLSMGKVRCVYCQTLLEKRRKGYGC